MAGSAFTGRDFKSDSGNILNNPLIGAAGYREMLVDTEWGPMTADITPANKGLVDCVVNIGETNIVKELDISETAGTRQARFAYQLEISDLPGAQGQVIPPLGDKNRFLYMEAEHSEIRSPQMPEHSNMERRDGYNTLKQFGSSAELAKRNVMVWHGVKRDMDMVDALLRGASNNLLSPVVDGGLAKDIGGVIQDVDALAGTNNATRSFAGGNPASPENFLCFDGAATPGTVDARLTSDTAAARALHEGKLADAVYALQTSPNKAVNVFTRNSLKGMYQKASEWGIRKVKGKNYDYVLMLDWILADQMIGTFDASADTKYLIGIWKTLSAGGRDMDRMYDARYEDLSLDGILIRPSRRLQGYRPGTIATDPDGTALSAGRVIWNANVATQGAWYSRARGRDHETNTQQVGLGFLLGDTALVSARDGGVEVDYIDGEAKTGRSWWGGAWRGVSRAVWRGKDPATSGTLRNDSSILVMGCVNGTTGKL